jgi:hypothetical protein
MSLETYWLVVPLAGIALTIPAWAWLLLARRREERGRHEERQGELHLTH